VANFANCEVKFLRLDSPRRANNVYIAGHAVAVILTQVIKLGREVFIECFAYADRKPIAHPGIETPIVEHFIGDKETELRWRKALQV
jgi:hypothetical protein